MTPSRLDAAAGSGSTAGRSRAPPTWKPRPDRAARRPLLDRTEQPGQELDVCRDLNDGPRTAERRPLDASGSMPPSKRPSGQPAHLGRSGSMPLRHPAPPRHPFPSAATAHRDLDAAPWTTLSRQQLPAVGGRQLPQLRRRHGLNAADLDATVTPSQIRAYFPVAQQSSSS
jgi:hypothetical protein